jgi:hypothetical protein
MINQEWFFFCGNRSVLFMPLRVAGVLGHCAWRRQETVPTGFLHFPAGRRFALHP